LIGHERLPHPRPHIKPVDVDEAEEDEEETEELKKEVVKVERVEVDVPDIVDDNEIEVVTGPVDDAVREWEDERSSEEEAELLAWDRIELEA
jgi:hypothetical protein